MRSKLRKFGIYLILVVSAFVATLFVGELGVTVYHIVRDGKYISPGDRLAAEKNAYVEEARAQTAKAAAMEIALSSIPIWLTCRRLWDRVVSVMPTARVSR